MELGAYRTSLRAYQEDEALAVAAERALGRGSAWSLGVRLGHDWQSGVSISSGLTYMERSVPLSYEDIRDSTSLQVTTLVTVFNNAMVDLAVDSQVTVLDQSVRGSGIQRYRSVQLPVVLGWHGRFRRWGFGASTGLLWEHLVWTAGPGLVRSAPNAHVALTSASESRKERRNADLLSLTFGVDIGFHLDERMSIWAGPMVQRGLVAVGGEDAPNGMPTNLGCQFRLTRSIP
jgi:hypothetical protein